MKKQNFVANLLLGVQIVCAAIHAVSQWPRLILTTQGIAPSWFVCWELFLVLNIILTIRAYQKKPSLVILNVFLIYAAWLIALTGDIILVMINNASWGKSDSLVIIAAIIPLAVIVAKQKKKTNIFNEPIIIGSASSLLRVIPQLSLSISMFFTGSAGIAGGTLLAGQVAIAGRLGSIYLAKHGATKESNRKWLFIAELFNYITWAIISVIWLIQNF